ncbi:MAG: SEC-C metal-binding domain-containing protein [Planctomycetota bacterium]
MSTTAAIGRNELCPCGSGQKHKHCCEGRQDIVQEASKSPWLLAGAAVVGLGVVATIAMQLGDPKPSDVNQPLARPMTTQSPIIDPAALLSPLPPPPGGRVAGGPVGFQGTAPPGKVWSAEHGHYHDLPATGMPMTVGPNGLTQLGAPASATGTLTPQPDGPVPEGKVWSPEHGHWHDLPGATPTTISSSELTPVSPPAGATGTLTPQPDGPVPEGKVWSPEHGHWHDLPGATPAIQVDGGGELVPIPPPTGIGTTPPPAPAPMPAETESPAPKPVDPPAPPPGTPPK